MTDLFRTGDPSRFALAARWLQDPDPPERRPADYGWSWGELEIIVGGHGVSVLVSPGGPASGIRWYLAPLLEWVRGMGSSFG